MKLTIRVYPVGTGLLSPSEQTQIAAWHHAAFANLPLSKQYEWAVGGHFNVLLDVDGEFSGFVGLMKREAMFDGRQKLIGGIRGLVIDPKWRKRGLGKIIMAEAHKVIFRTLKADLGFLLCLKELEPFYAALGWQTVRCQVFLNNKNQKVAWTAVAMMLSRAADSPLETFQEIDLLGAAF